VRRHRDPGGGVFLVGLVEAQMSDMDERFYSLQCSVLRGGVSIYRATGRFYLDEVLDLIDAIANEENQ
jgi:hypothetical protein